jgi:hypothetical protein
MNVTTDLTEPRNTAPRSAESVVQIVLSVRDWHRLVLVKSDRG